MENRCGAGGAMIASTNRHVPMRGALMAEELTFLELMQRLEAGDPDTAAEVFRLYVHRVKALAQKELDGRCRVMLSGSDVAQEVLNSFLRRQAQGPYDLDSEGALWGLLAEITFRKCGKW